MLLKHTLWLKSGMAVAALAMLLTHVPSHAQMPIQVDTSAPAADIKLPSFDTVSVKEHRGGDGSVRIMMKPNGYEATNVAISDLVAGAYGIRQDLVSGTPGWASGFHVDVNAKVADEDVATYKKLNGRQRNTMILAMLQERLKLQAHKEIHQLPTYDLVVDKGGPKLTISTARPFVPGEQFDPNSKSKPAGSMMTRPGGLSATGIPLQSLTNQLAYTVGRTVIDKTGLTGKYDIELHWTPEAKAGANADNGSDDATGDIFTALHEQLGLKLVSSKGPVETLVVDHIEKPSEN